MVQVRFLTIALVLSIGGVAQAANFTAPAPVLAGLQPQAAAGTIAFKDWRLEERASAESPAGVCVAATTALLGGVKHNLEIVIDRSAARPIETRIRPEGDLPGLVALKSTIDKKIYSFAKVASADAGRDVFWNVPRGTQELIDVLKRDLKLVAIALDGKTVPQSLTFSLRGSSAALAELAKRCNGGRVLGGDGFERAFLPAIVATVDPSKLTPSQTDLLRATVAKASVAYRTSALTAAQIQALVQKYLVQINELTKLKSNLDRLQNQEVIDLQKRRATSEGAITSAQQQIDALRPQIAANEAKLVQANADYEAAYRVLEPHIARFDQLVAAVRAAQSDEAAATKYLNDIDSNISHYSNEISRLNNELNSIRNSLSSARAEAQRRESEAQQSYRDMNSFDAQAEIRRRMQSDSDLSWLERRLRDLKDLERDAQRKLQNAEDRYRQAEQRHSGIMRDMQQAERTLDRAETSRGHALDALRRCQNTAGADCSTEQAKLQHAENEVQTARHQVDSLKSDYQRAQSELSNIRSHVSAAESDLRSAQRESNEVERRIEVRIDEIERVVHQHRNELVARYNQDRAEADRAQQHVNNLEASARDIANIELPRAQSELNRLSSMRPGALSDLRSAQQDVANARGARDAFKAQVGWDQKAAAVEAAQTRVTQIKGTLAQIDADIKKREKLIRDHQAVLVDVQKKMDVALEAIRTKQARSAEVQKALEPYDQQRAVLDQQKAQADQDFESSKVTFAANLPQ